ncbi:Stk1 family PASTA domain-containing Ser/Thr kinase [Eubacterium pyruvativorans]|uniref:Stk1 family PASTA domain-containing Ser/Thr kinase n=1 Tax=Eubacterium pyruvativorans TaxID=155865 RepID=UPI00156A6677|nr:Stk1 family PASTA domain-containing Ser/Thr kinase [Eubacterium pyruvativorans]
MSKLLVGRYELIGRIGEGGMAVVYKAKDRLLNRFVAVKILRPEFTKDAQFVDSFRKESQAAAGLQHPNIVSVYDVGHEGNIYFIVMELIDGMPLSEYIAQKAPMDYREVVRITKQVAQALSIAHKNNIIHRDIKPHNIMMTKSGIAKLGDFGIAKAISDSTLTETSKIIGSVHYFSPEQARGSYVDERSDIYSLGIIMYEMLTGRVPFDGDNPVQVALMHINNDVPRPSLLVKGIPPSLEKIVMRATDKFQSNRYKSADEMLQDLNSVEFVSSMVGDGIYDNNGYMESSNASSGAVNRERNARRPAYDDYDEDPYEKPKKKKKRRGGIGRYKKPILIALAAAALIGIGAFGLTKAGLFSSTVKVPDVTGRKYETAVKVLEARGLEVRRGNTVSSSKIAKGSVVDQDPDGGTEVKKGTVVTLDVSSGKKKAKLITVPNLVGQYYSSGLAQNLESQGFNVNITYDKSDDYKENQIMSQDPVEGSQVEKGSTINLTVCSGAKTEKVSVPSLTGLTYSQAKEKLTSAGLTTGSVHYDESNVYEEGYVMWQQYSAGTELEKGASVAIKISKGSGDSDNTGDKGGGGPDDPQNPSNQGDSGDDED